MPLVPYHPFRELERFFSDWPEIWETGIERAPRVDVYETNGDVVAEFELPGVKAEDIDLEVAHDTVMVRAKTEEKKKEQNKGYFRKEISRSYYKRVVPLSVEVKDEEAQAEYKNGVLKVVMPKMHREKIEKKGKKVKIKAKKE